MGGTARINATGVLALLVLLMVATAVQGLCTDHLSCDECFTNPQCGWCGDQDKDDDGIATKLGCHGLGYSHCSAANWMEWRTTSATTASTGDDAYMSPKRIDLSIRPGAATQVFEVDLEQVKRTPDIFFIRDATGSYASHKSGEDSMLKSALSILKNEYSGVGELYAGAASYKDFLRSPHCSAGDYFFKATCDLKPLVDVNSFYNSISNYNAGGGADGAEGQLSAIEKVLISLEDKWRDTSTRVVVISTDVYFHEAGGDRYRGTVLPFDSPASFGGGTIGRVETESLDVTFTKITKLRGLLEKYDVVPLFSIASTWAVPYYDKLVTMLGRGVVFSQTYGDASKFVANLKDAMDQTGQTVVIDKNMHDSRVRASMDLDPFTLAYGSTSKFKVFVDVPPTDAGYPTDPVEVKLQWRGKGLSTSIFVEVLPGCEECSGHPVADCPENSTAGTCGICHCDPGMDRNGLACECPADPSSIACDLQHGRVVCGTCECNSSEWSGPDCSCGERCPEDCNQDSVDQASCHCGVCTCPETHYGDACECAYGDDDTAKESLNNCNGHGSVNCGVCVCEAGWSGESCNDCIGRECMAEVCAGLSDPDNLGGCNACIAHAGCNWCAEADDASRADIGVCVSVSHATADARGHCPAPSSLLNTCTTAPGMAPTTAAGLAATGVGGVGVAITLGMRHSARQKAEGRRRDNAVKEAMKTGDVVSLYDASATSRTPDGPK